MRIWHVTHDHCLFRHDLKCTSAKGKWAFQLLLEYKGSTWHPERTCQTNRYLRPLGDILSESIDQSAPLLLCQRLQEEAEGASVVVNSRPRRRSQHVSNLRTQRRNDHHSAMGWVPLSSNPDSSNPTPLQIKHPRARLSEPDITPRVTDEPDFPSTSGASGRLL